VHVSFILLAVSSWSVMEWFETYPWTGVQTHTYPTILALLTNCKSTRRLSAVFCRILAEIPEIWPKSSFERSKQRWRPKVHSEIEVTPVIASVAQPA
jgi:hypothetical protein